MEWIGVSLVGGWFQNVDIISEATAAEAHSLEQFGSTWSVMACLYFS